MFEGLKDMGKLLKQAKEMKAQMRTIQKELKNLTVEGTGFEGKIRIVMNGEMEVLSVQLDPEVLGNRDKLQKGLQKAFNDACKEAKEVASSKLSKVSGDLNIPGLT